MRLIILQKGIPNWAINILDNHSLGFTQFPNFSERNNTDMANKIDYSVDAIQIVSQNDPMNITVLEELKYFIPPLQSAEWHQLQTNILSEGCRHALLVWRTYSNVISETASEALVEVNILIDGHNRYTICLQHGLDFPVQFIDFDSLQMAKNYMIEQQLGRRNLNPEQMAYLRGLRYNQDKQTKGKYERKKHSSHNDHYEEKSQNSAKTIEKVAELYHVSPKTIQRDADFAAGLDKLTLELRQSVLSGVVKVSKKDIQKLAKVTVDSPVETFEELTVLNQPIKKTKTAERVREQSPSAAISLSDMVRKCVPNANDSDLTVQIRGRFLLDNNLTETWKKLRGFDESVLIDESFTDTISIYQAPFLGLI
jgi:hypothetical protein